MKRKRLKASYTIEAAIYIPLLLFLMSQVLLFSIEFWKESRDRTVNEKLYELDIVQEFYTYQIIEELGKEILDD